MNLSFESTYGRGKEIAQTTATIILRRFIPRTISLWEYDFWITLSEIQGQSQYWPQVEWSREYRFNRLQSNRERQYLVIISFNYVDYFYFLANPPSLENKDRKPIDPLQSSSDEQELHLMVAHPVPASWLQALVHEVFSSDSIIVLDVCCLWKQNDEDRPNQPKGNIAEKCCVERRKRQRKDG